MEPPLPPAPRTTSRAGTDDYTEPLVHTPSGNPVWGWTLSRVNEPRALALDGEAPAPSFMTQPPLDPEVGG